jgi:L-alanine-DL-glutamate epimerase-like enolase superfamily enzyme
MIPLVRKTFGDDMALYADSNSFYSVKEAIRVGRLLEEYKYRYFEEPVMFDQIEDIKTARNFVDSALTELSQGKPVSVSGARAYGCTVKYGS